MKARLVISGALVLSAASIGVLAACATDESAPGGGDSGGTTLPSVDGGLELDAADTSAPPPEPCLPDTLCPGGPFVIGGPGGSLDRRTRINLIRGRSKNDVWAAGARGAVAHFDGAAWRRLDIGTVETINGLWLLDGGEVAQASLASVYTRGVEVENPASDGGVSTGGFRELVELTLPSNSSKRLSGSWSTGDSEWLWCTTLEGDGLNGLWRIHLDPSNKMLGVRGLAPEDLCGTLGCSQMTAIHGRSADDLWAVGFTGAIVRITDAQSANPIVTAYNSQTWAGLTGVWVAAEDDAWAVGGAGTIRHFTGNQYHWDIVAGIPVEASLNAIWGTSSTDIWAVGDGSLVLHYDGTTWSRVKVTGLGDRRPDLFTVWTDEPGHVWIGGDGVVLSMGGKP